MAVKAIDAVLAEPWAIMPEYLEIISSIAERENEHHGNLQALETKLGRPLGNTMSATVRDGVATIPVEGPLFRRANLMTEFSGATSYDMLAKDFSAALNDPSVKSIILYIDSPGGQTNGGSEFAQMVAAASKPVVAYIGGTGASAAYWIASAADKIVAADTAMVGSIGTQLGMTLSDPRPGQRTYTFVSTQSPLKNADPGTEAGASEAQRIVDSLSEVFISAVANNRNTTTDAVLANYGQGSVFVAADALSRGMIDSIGTYEAVLSDLSKSPKGSNMDFTSLTAEQLAANRPDLVAAIGEQAVAKHSAEAGAQLEAATADAATAERTRITEIMAAADGIDGAEAIVSAAIADPAKTSASVAIDLLKHVKAAGTVGKPSAAANPGKQHLSALADAENTNTMPTPSAESDQPTDIEKGSQAVEALRKQGLIA